MNFLFSGTTPLLSDIASVGGWQALDNWNRESWDMSNMLYNLIGVYSQGALISVSVKMDPRNSYLVQKSMIFSLHSL